MEVPEPEGLQRIRGLLLPGLKGARMSNKQKSITKIILAVLAVLGGSGAAIEGYVPDLEAVQQLGVFGSVALIAYLHLVWLPLVRRGDAKLDTILQHVAPASSTAAPAEQMPRVASGPALAVVTAKEPR